MSFGDALRALQRGYNRLPPLDRICLYLVSQACLGGRETCLYPVDWQIVPASIVTERLQELGFEVTELPVHGATELRFGWALHEEGLESLSLENLTRPSPDALCCMANRVRKGPFGTPEELLRYVSLRMLGNTCLGLVRTRLVFFSLPEALQFTHDYAWWIEEQKFHVARFREGAPFLYLKEPLE